MFDEAWSGISILTLDVFVSILLENSEGEYKLNTEKYLIYIQKPIRNKFELFIL